METIWVKTRGFKILKDDVLIKHEGLFSLIGYYHKDQVIPTAGKPKSSPVQHLIMGITIDGTHIQLAKYSSGNFASEVLKFMDGYRVAAGEDYLYAYEMPSEEDEKRWISNNLTRSIGAWVTVASSCGPGGSSMLPSTPWDVAIPSGRDELPGSYSPPDTCNHCRGKP